MKHYTGHIKQETIFMVLTSVRAGTHKRDSQRDVGVIQGLRKEPSLGTRIFLADERPVRPAQAASAAGYSGQASGR